MLNTRGQWTNVPPCGRGRRYCPGMKGGRVADTGRETGPGGGPCGGRGFPRRRHRRSVRPAPRGSRTFLAPQEADATISADPRRCGKRG